MIKNALGFAVAFCIPLMAYVPDKLNTVSFPGGNFLSNWSFEEGVSGWTASGLIVSQEQTGLWGKRSLKVSPLTTGVSGTLTQELSSDLGGYFDQKKIETLAGSPFRFSIHVKPSEISSISVSIEGAAISNQDYPTVSPGIWSRLEVTTSGMAANGVGKYVFTLKCHSGSSVNIDDAIVEMGQGPFFQDISRSALFTSNSGSKIQSQGRIDDKVTYGKVRYDDDAAGGQAYQYDQTFEVKPLEILAFSISQYESAPGQGPSTSIYRFKSYNADPSSFSEHSDTQFHLSSPHIDGVIPAPGNPYLAARELKTVKYLTTQIDLAPGTVNADLPKSNVNKGAPGYSEPLYSIQEQIQKPNSTRTNRTRIWTDAYGREVQVAEVNSTGTAMLATRKEYDLEGNVTKIVPPKGVAYSQVKTFEKYTRRLLSATSPDEGTKEIRYLKSGLVKFEQDAKQKAEGIYTANVYDQQQRLVAVHSVTSKPGYTIDDAINLNAAFPIGSVDVLHQAVKEYSYDWNESHATFGSRDCLLPKVGKYELKYVFSRIYKIKILDNRATQIDDGIDQYYSYDERGNIVEIIAVMDNRITMERLEYALNGGVVRRRYYVCPLSTSILSVNPVLDIGYKYNSNNELVQVHDNRAGQDIVLQEVEYDIEGRLVSQVLLPDDPNKINQAYDYNSLGWMTKIVSDYTSGRFISEYNYDLDKDGQFTGQGDGRITQVKRYTVGDASLPESREVAYKYDVLGQMSETKSLDILNPQKNGLTDVKYEFGDHGEITSVQKGSAAKINYEYNPSTHQLKGLTGNLSTGRDLTRNGGNFEYYANGLVKKDFSRNLLVKYDWRSLPVEMIYHADQSYSVVSKTVSFVYNVEGIKISEIVSE